jgi:hypothetical protein
LIPDAPHPSTNPTPKPPVASHVVDGMIGTFQIESQSKQASHSNPKYVTANVQKLFLQLLLPVKPLRLIRFNLHLPIKFKIKRKGRVRIRRKKIIINNPINPRLGLLMTKKNANLVILVLFVVRIII